MTTTTLDELGRVRAQDRATLLTLKLSAAPAEERRETDATCARIREAFADIQEAARDLAARLEEATA